MAWLNNFTGFLKDMEEYIKNNHRTGLSFTGQGEAKAGIGSSSGGGAAAAAPSGGPKAPPPMPKGFQILLVFSWFYFIIDCCFMFIAPLVDKAALDALAKPAAGGAAGGEEVKQYKLNMAKEITTDKLRVVLVLVCSAN